jgi:hypothetical protein
MPDLAQSLGGHDLGYLQIVAELWGLELSVIEFQQGMDVLVPLLLEAELVTELLKSLPEEAQEALEELLSSEGRMSWALFTRRYGEIREMGSGRRDRDRPYLEPGTMAEILWYRALIGRGFFDTQDGLEEFAYIPDDFIPLISAGQLEPIQVFGRAALPAERGNQFPATDRIVDDACTLLAALRLGIPLGEVPLSHYMEPYSLKVDELRGLLEAADLLGEDEQPDPNETRRFLEAGRGEALARLTAAWKASDEFNELILLPGLELEGEWANNPRRARQSVLDFLASIPDKTWWNIESFVAAVHQTNPDFQRPAGDYDSWYIRQTESGEYLRGFKHWGQVDGQLLRYLLAGPLHWLGILDLAAPEADKPASTFRFSRWSQMLLAGKELAGFPLEDKKIQLKSDASLSLSRLVPRSVRYQVARFTQWESFNGEVYRYRFTPSSLERAARKGLTVSHLLNLLEGHAEAVPPSLVKGLQRWQEGGSQARLEQLLVLRVKAPEILQELRNSKAVRFLGEPLGQTSVIVKPGAREKVLAALAEMGYLGEIFLE